MTSLIRKSLPSIGPSSPATSNHQNGKSGSSIFYPAIVDPPPLQQRAGSNKSVAAFSNSPHRTSANNVATLATLSGEVSQADQKLVPMVSIVNDCTNPASLTDMRNVDGDASNGGTITHLEVSPSVDRTDAEFLMRQRLCKKLQLLDGSGQTIGQHHIFQRSKSWAKYSGVRNRAPRIHRRARSDLSGFFVASPAIQTTMSFDHWECGETENGLKMGRSGKILATTSYVAYHVCLLVPTSALIVSVIFVSPRKYYLILLRNCA